MDVLGQYLAEARPQRQPEEMLQALLADINRRFYNTADARAWLRDQKQLMLALTWPATWLAQRGISIPTDRYEKILREVLATIERHGNTAAIRHFPAYLLDCVRKWYLHQGEALYHERKHLRNAIDVRALVDRRTTTAPDPVEALAAAHRVLATASKRTKSAPKDASQGSLFDL